jgi:hypothetical protein
MIQAIAGSFFEDVTVNASDPAAKFMASDLWCQI